MNSSDIGAVVAAVVVIILVWGRFAVGQLRARYARWARSLRPGQLILYCATMALVGGGMVLAASPWRSNSDNGDIVMVLVAAALLFRAYWAAWLWLGRETRSETNVDRV